MQFIKVTLAIRPDVQLIIPKQKILEIRGSKVGNTDCSISYEVRGQLAIVEVTEDIETINKLLRDA
jgi:hypothetical protein